MNNSLDRLLGGIVDALRREVIPHLSDEFARGQAFAAIDVLQNLQPRLDWAAGPLLEQLAGQQACARRVRELAPDSPAVAAELMPATVPVTGRDLRALRDALDNHLSDVVAWLAARGGDAALDPARAVLRAYMQAQVRREVALAAKPLFGEIAGNA